MARIEDGCLVFCRNIRSNEFLFKYPLYNQSFDVMFMSIDKRPENKIKTVTEEESTSRNINFEINPSFDHLMMGEGKQYPGENKSQWD